MKREEAGIVKQPQHPMLVEETWREKMGFLRQRSSLASLTGTGRLSSTDHKCRAQASRQQARSNTDLQRTAPRAIKSTFQSLRQHLQVLRYVCCGQTKNCVRGSGGGEPSEDSRRCSSFLQCVIREELTQARLCAYCVGPLCTSAHCQGAYVDQRIMIVQGNILEGKACWPRVRDSFASVTYGNKERTCAARRLKSSSDESTTFMANAACSTKSSTAKESGVGPAADAMMQAPSARTVGAAG